MTFPWKALYIFCISVLSKHNLNIKDVLIETMQWLDHTFLYPKPQKLSKYEMSQLEFSDFFCRHVFCVSLLSFNYGVLVDIKHFIMWKLVLQLKSKDSLCKYSISLNVYFSTTLDAHSIQGSTLIKVVFFPQFFRYDISQPRLSNK